jgi:hypothetical protein
MDILEIEKGIKRISARGRQDPRVAFLAVKQLSEKRTAMDDENDIDDEEEENIEELEIEEVTLDKIEEDGEILALMDGRRLLVNPGDIATALLWLPTSTLEVIERDEDEDGFFNLSIILEETDQEIRARWETESST